MKYYPRSCPICKSRDFEQEYEHDGDETLVEKCTCSDCQYIWENTFEFACWAPLIVDEI